MKRKPPAVPARERRVFLSALGATAALAGWRSGAEAAPLPIASPFVTARDGCRIAYADFGPRAAPPLFFCTMGSSAMSVWTPVARPLSNDYRVILHDRRGNGDSDPGAPASHTFDQFRDDAIAVMDKLGIARATVCGMAFGARVALRLARDDPGRVSKLILFDATGGPAAPEARRLAGAEEAARLRTAAGLPTPTRDPAWFARRDPAGERLNAAAFRGEPDWIGGLEQVRAPTLIACGEQDPNLAGARRLAKEIRNARFRPMPMTGHASILERPDLVLQYIREFA